MANTTSETPTASKAVEKTSFDMPNGGTKSADISRSRPAVTKQVRYSFQKKPFVIGVAGGTASGKSTVCSKIMEKLGPLDPTSVYLSHEKRVICLSQDSFYRKLSEDEKGLVAKGNFNFDHPSAFDVKLLVNTLREIQNGKMVKVPVYNYVENEIGDTEEVIYPADVVLVEGLLLFYFPEVREMFQMKIFVDTDPDTRLSRRVIRDVNERHRPLDVVLSQYTKFVKPSFEEFCLPTKKYADIIVPRGPDNEVAVDLIVTHVHSIFDPSIRHQSIKYYDDEPIRYGAKTTGEDARKRAILAKKQKQEPRHNGCYYMEDDIATDCETPPMTVASVGSGRCATPVLNGNSKSKPIQISNGLFASSFASSSAPSHLSGFAHGMESNQNGFSSVLNGAISSEDEGQEEEEEEGDGVFVNGDPSAQSSQSPHCVPPPRVATNQLPSSGKVAKTPVTSSSSQPKAQQPTAPILLVASR